jgi:hypothetical protein
LSANGEDFFRGQGAKRGQTQRFGKVSQHSPAEERAAFGGFWGITGYIAPLRNKLCIFRSFSLWRGGLFLCRNGVYEYRLQNKLCNMKNRWFFRSVGVY